MTPLMKNALRASVFALLTTIAIPAFAQRGGPPADISPRDQARLRLLEKMKKAEAKKGDAGTTRKTKAKSSEPEKKAKTPKPALDVAAEMVKHKRRMARLLRIETIARQRSNSALLEKVQNIRQLELQRHTRFMSRAHAQNPDAG